MLHGDTKGLSWALFKNPDYKNVPDIVELVKGKQLGLPNNDIEEVLVPLSKPVAFFYVLISPNPDLVNIQVRSGLQSIIN